MYNRAMGSSFYNTTSERNPQLKMFEGKAATQEDVVAEYFARVPEATPSAIQANCLPNAPMTSIRRAMTNLTNRGILRKSSEKRMGKYGRPEHVWKRV